MIKTIKNKIKKTIKNIYEKDERFFTFMGVCGFLFTLLLIIFTLSSCNSADKNLTSYDINCKEEGRQRALICCLQYMSSNTGNESKDVMCKDLVIELSDFFKEKRKQDLYSFCLTQADFNRCWDKINSK